MAGHADIAGALETRLSTLPGSTDIAYENAGYSPTIGTPYLAVTHQPAQTTQAAIGIEGTDLQTGVMAIGVYYPKNQGRGSASTKADAIIEHFKRGTTLTLNGVKVLIRQTWRNQAVVDADWYQVPVSILYQSYTDV